MLRPGTHAHPTELILALLARHMTNQSVSIRPPNLHILYSLAPSILLDRRLTLGTLLRITLDPIRRLTIILTLLQPQLRDTANQGSMIPFRASKTEIMPFSALNRRH